VVSRVTSGVKLMRLNESDVVVSIAKVRETVSKNPGETDLPAEENSVDEKSDTDEDPSDEE
jgi:hypothetical protein